MREKSKIRRRVLTVRDSENIDTSFPCTRTNSICSTSSGTLELDFDSIIQARNLPWLVHCERVSIQGKQRRRAQYARSRYRAKGRELLRRRQRCGTRRSARIKLTFNLIASLVDYLFEDTVLIAKRVSPDGQIRSTC